MIITAKCGVTLAKFADVKEGDVYEAFKMEEYRGYEKEKLYDHGCSGKEK